MKGRRGVMITKLLLRLRMMITTRDRPEYILHFFRSQITHNKGMIHHGVQLVLVHIRRAVGTRGGIRRQGGGTVRECIRGGRVIRWWRQ